MITVTTPAELRAQVAAWRREGQSIGFVPTMGALHEGHQALVRRSRELADRTVVSIFVNPTQFDRADDLEAYPRSEKQDAELLVAEGADLLFLPPVDAVYPPGDATRVRVTGPAEGLEGGHRPGHFDGVATVVTRLFNLVRPDLAVFGEKDAQQLAVVQRMVRDLHQPVEIVPHPTVRETDGLALSSRNLRLSADDRRRALALSRALDAARAAADAGVRDANALRGEMRRVLADTLTSDDTPDGSDPVEYAEVVDGDSFQPVDRLPDTGRVILPVAAWCGGVRLIDNQQWDMSSLREEPTAAASREALGAKS